VCAVTREPVVVIGDEVVLNPAVPEPRQWRPRSPQMSQAQRAELMLLGIATPCCWTAVRRVLKLRAWLKSVKLLYEHYRASAQPFPVRAASTAHSEAFGLSHRPISHQLGISGDDKTNFPSLYDFA
jgi:hypothetical protein